MDTTSNLRALTGRKHFFRALLTAMPLPVFGASLGLLGVALLPFPERWDFLGKLFIGVGVCVFIGIVICHILKCFVATSIVLADAKNPALMPFSAQISVALYLLAEIFHQQHWPSALPLYYIAVATMVVQLMCWGAVLSNSQRLLDGLGPSWFVPGISLLYAAALAVPLGHPVPAYFMLLLGTVMSIAVFVLLCHSIKHRLLPENTYPGLNIVVAIPALWLLAALFILPARHMGLHLLYWGNLVIFIASTVFFFYVRRGQFAVSWWAFGMPLCASVIAQYSYANLHDNEWLMLLSQANLAVCLIVISVVTYMAMRSVKRSLYNAKH